MFNEIIGARVKEEIRARLESDLYKKKRTCYEVIVIKYRNLLRKFNK